MKTFLANAFAVVRLTVIHEFHLSHRNTNAPVCPSQSLPRLSKTNKIEPKSYSIIPPSNSQANWPVKSGQAVSTRVVPPARTQDPTKSFLNTTNFNIRYWSWNYRGCWHQTCPPIYPQYEALKKISYFLSLPPHGMRGKGIFDYWQDQPGYRILGNAHWGRIPSISLMNSNLLQHATQWAASTAWGHKTNQDDTIVHSCPTATRQSPKYYSIGPNAGIALKRLSAGGPLLCLLEWHRQTHCPLIEARETAPDGAGSSRLIPALPTITIESRETAPDGAGSSRLLPPSPTITI